MKEILHYNFENMYTNLNFFGTPAGFDVVSVVVLPAGKEKYAKKLKLRFLNTGKIGGRVVDESESPWPRRYRELLPPQLHVIQANMEDFTTLVRDERGAARIPDDLRFEVVYDNKEPIVSDRVYTWYGYGDLPIPQPENIKRVTGPVGPIGHLLGGATVHAHFQDVIRNYLGREPKDLKILDWGVGCGRVARHFLEQGCANVFGVDIDNFNIDWVRSNFGWENAKRIDFDPPMPYADSFFDVVYGISIFTHLSKEDHVRWLREIRRILKPGGIALLTVCTEDGLYLTRYKHLERELPRLCSDGFLDAENQSYFGVDKGREGYYRLSFQTREFIGACWNDFFSVQEIRPCYFQAQDLVIAKR